MAPYALLEDAPTSDAGFVARGVTLDECFQAAAEATLAIMLGNLESLRTEVVRTVQVTHEALDLLLVRVLDEIVYFKDAEGLFLRASEARVTQTEAGWQASLRLEGEPIDPERHQRSSDIKAITLHRLSIEKTAGVWQATVVVDV